MNFIWDRASEIELGKTIIVCLLIWAVIRIINFVYILFLKNRKDNCEVCKGSRGGQWGNENRVAGKVMCDYCSVDYDDSLK
jgi:hypothetical protein